MKDDEKSVGAERGTDRPLPAGWGWRTRREEDDPYPLRVLASEQASAREWIAEAHGDGRWFVHESESEDATAEIAKGRATPRPGESLSAAAQREAESALWARDGFGVGEVYGARLAMAREIATGAVDDAPVVGSGIPSRGETAECGPGPGAPIYATDIERAKCMFRARLTLQRIERERREASRVYVETADDESAREAQKESER